MKASAPIIIQSIEGGYASIYYSEDLYEGAMLQEGPLPYSLSYTCGDKTETFSYSHVENDGHQLRFSEFRTPELKAEWQNSCLSPYQRQLFMRDRCFRLVFKCVFKPDPSSDALTDWILN